jgi:hypothetical protein
MPSRDLDRLKDMRVSARTSEIAVTRSTIDCTGTRFGLKLKRLATDPDARSSVVPVAIITGTATTSKPPTGAKYSSVASRV